MTWFRINTISMWRAKLGGDTGRATKRYSRRYSDKLWPFSSFVLGCACCVLGVPVLLVLWVGVV